MSRCLWVSLIVIPWYRQSSIRANQTTAGDHLGLLLCSFSSPYASGFWLEMEGETCSLFQIILSSWWIWPLNAGWLAGTSRKLRSKGSRVTNNSSFWTVCFSVTFPVIGAILYCLKDRDSNESSVYMDELIYRFVLVNSRPKTLEDFCDQRSSQNSQTHSWMQINTYL